MVRVSIVYSDHEIEEFRILTGGSKTNSQIVILDFRRKDFDLLRDMLGRIMGHHPGEKKGLGKNGQF